jgi:20S proteasome alpha/beta subunit
MTTIATDGITLATDTRMVSGYINQGHAEKVVQFVDEDGETITLAGAGEYGKVRKFFDWVVEGCDPAEYSDADGEYSNFLMISKGKLYSFEGHHVPFEAPYPVAIGSGSHFALGAMLHGASPEEAVKIAMQLDVNTGGDVIVYDVGGIE